jgi:S-DNA-T family DNA segregation ATPase FtsK/SpoIIIE
MGRDPYRRYNRRMRRAMRGRDGTYPMLILGTQEPYAWLAFAAFCKWTHRHRSALAPFTITLPLFIAAAIIHGHHARWWIPVTVVTALVTVMLGVPHSLLRRHPAGRRIARFLARLWEACGIDRAIERAYAAVVVAVAGGWLAAAIAAGPAVKPLPQVALSGSVVLGIPWWFHRRRRAKVRVERIVDGWPDVAANVGLPGAHIVSAVVDAWGWTARVLLKKGITTEQAISKIPAIESNLGLRPGSVRITADQERADRFTMQIIENDPHATPAPWPGPSINSVAQPVGIGISENGRPVRVTVLRRNVLIGGIMGSGKSGILNILIANLAGCPDVVLWGVDLKGGMELRPWAACFDRLATSPDQAAALFRDAVARLNDRAERKAGEGQRVWEPTKEDPALIIIIDEYAELPAEAHDCADSLARRGRAVAVNLIAATQRPTQEAMGKTAVRSQMDIRICLRVRERRDVDLILGQGSFNAGWHAHQLAQPGAFLISSPGHQAPERHRAYLITDAQISHQAAGCAPGRPSLGDTPAPAQPEPEKMPPASRWPQAGVRWPHNPGQDLMPSHEQGSPETALWDALSHAGPDGVPAGVLLQVTGMSKTTLYRRLRALATAGRAVQTARGCWRAAGPPHEPDADGRVRDRQ